MAFHLCNVTPASDISVTLPARWVRDEFVGDDLAGGSWPGCLSRAVYQIAARSAAGIEVRGLGGGQSSSRRPLACWQRSAMMSRRRRLSNASRTAWRAGYL